MIDVAKLRGLLAAAVLNARRLPLTVVLEDGANPEGGYSWNLGDCHDMFVCGNMSRNEAEAIAAAVNAMPMLLDELEALRDCGQAGVCRVPPGCARHWEERNRELVAECEALRADADVLETVAENRHVRADKADAEVLAWRTATGCDTPEEAKFITSAREGK